MEEIIIGGVNVAGCEYFAKQNEHSCLEENGICKNISDCYYKQLKRLEQENARLKEKIKKYAAINEQETKDYAELKAENECLKQEFEIESLTDKTTGKTIYRSNLVNKLKELLKVRIENLCESCGASSMMPMPCTVYKQTLQEIKAIAEEIADTGNWLNCGYNASRAKKDYRPYNQSGGRMNNFEKIKNLTLDEMIDLFVVIETYFDVVDIDINGIKHWLQAESEG